MIDNQKVEIEYLKELKGELSAHRSKKSLMGESICFFARLLFDISA